jgi:peptidoglycan/xylan/chitin deacetylase (PgdA/CDA1 family)
MKFIYLYLMILLVFSGLSFVPSLVSAENLVINSSLESGGNSYPDNWQREKRGNNIAVFSYVRNDRSATRHVSIETIQYGSGHAGWFFSPVSVSGGGKYEYESRYQASTETKLVARIFEGSTFTDVPIKTVPPSAVTWTTLKTNIDIPATATAFTVLHQSVALGKLAIDDVRVSLVEGESPEPDPKPSPDPSPKPLPDTQNLIPNPSFENTAVNEPERPASWYPRQFGSNKTNFIYPTTEASDGNRAIKIEVSDHTSGFAFYEPEPFAIEGGKTYEFSYRYRADTYAEVDVAFYLADGTVKYQYLGVSVPSPSSWSTFTTQVVAPENAVRASMYALVYSNSYLVSDEYRLIEANTVRLPKPIVSLTFDDAFTSFYDNALPLFDEYDMAGTIYLVSQDFDDPKYMTPTQLKALENYGFEMGSHSVTHAHLPQLSLDELRYELEESKRIIEERLETNIEHFATPYGEYNDQVLNEIMRVYDSHRSVDVGYNGADFSPRNIRSMSPTNTTTVEEVLDWVDMAIANDTWLTITYHDIVNGGGKFTNTPAHLEAVLAGLSARGVAVMTVGEALQYLDDNL